MYTVEHYEAVIRYVYQKLINGEGTGPEHWACLLWLHANDHALLKQYHQQLFDKCNCKLCAKCGADTENWQEVFGEEHKCEVRL